MNAISLHKKLKQVFVLPPPVAVTSAWRLLQRSHCDKGKRALAIPSSTQSGKVPFPGLSRNFWTSKTNKLVPPTGSMMALNAAADPLDTNVVADAKSVPGNRMICCLAPAARMACTPICSVFAHAGTDRSCGSFCLTLPRWEWHLLEIDRRTGQRWFEEPQRTLKRFDTKSCRNRHLEDRLDQ